MKRFKTMTCAVLGAAALCLPAGMANASVIPIAGSGNASGSTTIGRMFDAQPATDPVAGIIPPGDGTGYDPGSEGLWYNSDPRTAYIDFGTNWASISITDTYELTHYKYSSHIPGGTGNTYAWSSDTSVGGDTAAPNFGFQAAGSTELDQQWLHRYSGPAVTPQARYLLVTHGDETGITSSSEWVFVNSGTVPEPASLALLGVGGLVMLGRRRKRAC